MCHPAVLKTTVNTGMINVPIQITGTRKAAGYRLQQKSTGVKTSPFTDAADVAKDQEDIITSPSTDAADVAKDLEDIKTAPSTDAPDIAKDLEDIKTSPSPDAPDIAKDLEDIKTAPSTDAPDIAKDLEDIKTAPSTDAADIAKDLEDIKTSPSTDAPDTAKDMEDIKTSPSTDAPDIAKDLEDIKTAPSTDAPDIAKDLEDIKTARSTDAADIAKDLEDIKTAPSTDAPDIAKDLEDIKPAPSTDAADIAKDLEDIKTAPSTDADDIAKDLEDFKPTPCTDAADVAKDLEDIKTSPSTDAADVAKDQEDIKADREDIKTASSTDAADVAKDQEDIKTAPSTDTADIAKGQEDDKTLPSTDAADVAKVHDKDYRSLTPTKTYYPTSSVQIYYAGTDGRGMVPGLDTIHREVMDIHHEDLLDVMEPRQMTCALLGLGAIGDFQCLQLDLKYSEGERAANRLLLDYLWRQGTAGFVSLVTALKRCYLDEMANILMDTEAHVCSLYFPQHYGQELDWGTGIATETVERWTFSARSHLSAPLHTPDACGGRPNADRATSSTELKRGRKAAVDRGGRTMEEKVEYLEKLVYGARDVNDNTSSEEEYESRRGQFCFLLFANRLFSTVSTEVIGNAVKIPPKLLE
nr:hypothetical protein BaRGS_032928 [Batillaria attramentaria]